MLLIAIDKSRYRRHVKKVIVGSIVALTVGSLSISQSLIALFPREEGTHFHWNLFGVVVTAFLMILTFRRFKSHPFMYEVAYVWDLKKALNLIHRKMRRLLVAQQAGDRQAYQALQFFYEGSRQLADLDDNTITLDDLVEKHRALELAARQADIPLDASAWSESYVRGLA